MDGRNEPVLLRDDDAGVVRLTLSRPEARNTLSRGLMARAPGPKLSGAVRRTLRRRAGRPKINRLCVRWLTQGRGVNRPFPYSRRPAQR
jgi:hypothetical protein